MTTPKIAPPGAPVWVDLATDDVQRAQHFYGTVFGWRFDAAGGERGGYVTATTAHGRVVAGLMTHDAGCGASLGWTTYLHTADIGETLARVVEAGGTAAEPVQIPGRGSMAVVGDATGGRVGLWQPAGHTGFEVVGAAGSPVWHHYATPHYRAALDFYTEVFRWRPTVESDSDEFRYVTVAFDGEPLLGVMDMSLFPGEHRSEWTVFLGVVDVDATLRAVTDNGGSVVRGPDDTPYGRLASVTDPMGTNLNVSSLRG